MTLRLGSLFSGIGGLELGLEAALGAETMFQVECDPYCRSVLARHWPRALRLGDVRCDDKARSQVAVDVLCGGPPCQPHSLAGARLGRDDERHLWPAMMDWVRSLEPALVVMENVPGLLTSSMGEVFSEVLSDLHAAGYDAQWRSVAAEDVGAPHRRRRVFVVARRRSALRQRVIPPMVTPYWFQPMWPARPGCDQWSFEPSRVIAQCVERVPRLKGLGNAVVPHVGLAVGVWAREILAGTWAPLPGERVLVEFVRGQRQARQLGLFDAPGDAACPAWGPHGSMVEGLVRVARVEVDGTEDADADRSLWPTPRATESEMRTYAPCPTHGSTHGRHLQAEVIALDGDPTAPPKGKRRAEIGALNPDWVELLMGYAEGWTVRGPDEPAR